MESSNLGKANSTYLNPDNLSVPVVPQILNPLICQICLGVVNRPLECQECQTLFCQQEIKEIKEQKCPLCRSSKWRGGGSIHKSYRSALSNLLWKCTAQSCSNLPPLSYEKYIKHLQVECKGECIPVSTRPTNILVVASDKHPYYKYYYDSDRKAPEAYSESQNATFNLNVQRGNMRFEVLDTYQIDLVDMTQTNKYTKYGRTIFREEQPGHQPKAWWFVEADSNPCHALQSQASDLFEQQHQSFLAGKSDGRFNYRFNAWNYQVDLNRMTQTNVKSKRQRKFFRAVI